MHTILICDDDKDIVSALDIYLTSEGYKTLRAYNGMEALDLALVPCSTGSRSGRRLGYGGGYYDRFLPRTTCPKALLCRGRLVREDIPTEDHDQLMDFLVTEEGLTSCR